MDGVKGAGCTRFWRGSVLTLNSLEHFYERAAMLEYLRLQNLQLRAAHVNITPFSYLEAAFLIIENMHIAKGKALIIQPLSQYREVIHYWVQSKVKDIKLQPLSKMVTGMVVMTQSEYIARRKQGQEYSRPGKGYRVKVGNNQPTVQSYMGHSTFQLE